MGVDIFWEDENSNRLGNVSAFWTPLFDISLPAYEAEDYPCLRFVDPYGDTVFNHMHLPQLIIELKMIAARIGDEKTLQYIDEIIKLVTKAQNQVHTYIKFYGD